jgi:hypothetical protein
LSDASDSEDAVTGEFANVINKMNNAAGNGRGDEVDEEGNNGGDEEGQPGVVGNGVVAAVAGVAPPDGVAPAVAIPRGRGPGRSRTLPAGAAAGVVGPPPARAPPGPAVARTGSAAACGAEVESQISGSSGTATASDRGHAFRTPINRGRKRCTGDGDDDDKGVFSASNIMGRMMVQQRSEQTSRDADCAAREAELALWQEEITMCREEMMSQLQIQREEKRCGR